MIAVDTNVVVRLLTGDEETQHRKARALFEKNAVFITETVILECEWVLRYAYDFTPTAICDALNRLFGLPHVHLENPTAVKQAIQWHASGLDFADALHLARCQHVDRFVTFDAKLVRRASRLGRCPVLRP